MSFFDISSSIMIIIIIMIINEGGDSHNRTNVLFGR